MSIKNTAHPLPSPFIFTFFKNMGGGVGMQTSKTQDTAIIKTVLLLI